MKKVWVNKVNSFKEAKDFEDRYYFSMTPEERLSNVQFCREEYLKIKKDALNEDRKRFRRLVKIIKQKQG